MSVEIAPTARVHSGARIGAGSVIGEYCVIEADVVIGEGCVLEPYVYIKRFTTMGDGNRISAGAALGTDPFDRAFAGEPSYLRIGHRNIIREHFTVSRGTKPESFTTIGDDNYIMGSGHIAHNCTVGSRCTIASNALIAGYVTVEDQAFLSGGVVVHQFSKIGRLAMIGGNVRVNQDAPPYFLYAKFDIEPRGLNVVGLRRAGFLREEVAALREAYRLLYSSGLKLDAALERIDGIATVHTKHLAEFVRSSERGIARPKRGAAE